MKRSVHQWTAKSLASNSVAGASVDSNASRSHALRGSQTERSLTQPSHSDGLCAKCKEIDFVKIFALPGPRFTTLEIGRPVTELRHDFNADCRLCLLFLKLFSSKRNHDVAAEAELRQQGYCFIVLDCLTVMKAPRLRSSIVAGSSMVIAVLTGKQKLSLGAQSEAIGRGVIVPVRRVLSSATTATTRVEYCGAAIKPSQINFTQVTCWMNECSETHKKCRAVFQPKRHNFKTKVIDCLTRQIVPLGERMKYVTLSYVWGLTVDANGASLQDDFSNCLPTEAPRTIEDAILVTKGLCQRYLWVDRYCIQGADEKHEQIQHMDQIYEGSVITVVAATGTNSDAGICGVSSPRTNQPQAVTNAGSLVATGRHLSYHFSISKWATRGWTYQETFVSRRCLFFTTDGVVFACRTHLRSESVSHSPTKSYPQDCLHPMTTTVADQNKFTKGYGGNYSRRIQDHIKEFTTRSLTFESDGLNAFRGMLARHSLPSYWGVPLLSKKPEKLSADGAFALGLSWTCCRSKNTPDPEYRARRREHFPTWSWVSVVDDIEFLSDSDVEIDLCSTFSLEDSCGQLESLDCAIIRLSEANKLIPERTRYLHISGPLIKVRFRDHNVWADSTFVEGAWQVGHHCLKLDTVIEDHIKERLIEDVTWSAIGLWNQGISLPKGTFLLLDWQGSTASRIGLFTMTTMNFLGRRDFPWEERDTYQTVRLE
jgi:hypothetical protein